MSQNIILIHPEALRSNHPIFRHVSNNTQAIFVWDEELFKELNYSLKRLIFVYESLIELPVEIIHGDTLEIISTYNPQKIFIPFTHNPTINKYYENINSVSPVEVINDVSFSTVKPSFKYSRFFQYWNKAKKSVMNVNVDLIGK